ncbi:MAG: hypothetical protein ACM3MB_11955 [Acidobacteriota bacterium]
MLVDSEDLSAETLKQSVPHLPKRRIGLARLVPLIVPLAAGTDNDIIRKTPSAHVASYLLEVFFRAGPTFFGVALPADFFAATFLAVFLAGVVSGFFFAGPAFLGEADTLETSTPQQ